jgi:hypothetical protein
MPRELNDLSDWIYHIGSQQERVPTHARAGRSCSEGGMGFLDQWMPLSEYSSPEKFVGGGT